MLGPGQCSDNCAWACGLIAAIFFGSFGVPIKLSAKVSADPLVMQTYKVLSGFMTCWLIIPLGGEIKFTPLGIISGMFWIPGGMAGIYGIQNAGLAVSVGTWSSFIVITSFCWGILVFGEKLKSVPSTMCGMMLLIIGLVGMSTNSAPKEKIDEDLDVDLIEKQTKQHVNNIYSSDKIELFNGRISTTRRKLGIAGAVVNGTWGSCKYVPMHYARGYTGADYLISFCTGSMFILLLVWIGRFLHNMSICGGNLKQATESMPSLHLRKLWLPGFSAGLLYSIANFCSLVTVDVLGQGVGYSFIQSSMMVSGFWSIYLGELQGQQVKGWLASSILAILGIAWISFEHQH